MKNVVLMCFLASAFLAGTAYGLDTSQSMHVDVAAMGGTLWNVSVGVGLIDDRISVDAGFGVAPDGRFAGPVLMLRQYADVISIEYGKQSGEQSGEQNGERAASSFRASLGAVVNYYFESSYMLAAGVVRLTPWRHRIETWPFLSVVAPYVEVQFWIVASDVQSGITPRISLGLKLNVL